MTGPNAAAMFHVEHRMLHVPPGRPVTPAEDRDAYERQVAEARERLRAFAAANVNVTPCDSRLAAPAATR